MSKRLIKINKAANRRGQSLFRTPLIVIVQYGCLAVSDENTMFLPLICQEHYGQSDIFKALRNQMEHHRILAKKLILWKRNFSFVSNDDADSFCLWIEYLD
jgi:hypothetical protein